MDMDIKKTDPCGAGLGGRCTPGLAEVPGVDVVDEAEIEGPGGADGGFGAAVGGVGEQADGGFVVAAGGADGVAEVVDRTAGKVYGILALQQILSKGT